jgi:hypothetical protein
MSKQEALDDLITRMTVVKMNLEDSEKWKDSPKLRMEDLKLLKTLEELMKLVQKEEE